MKKSLRITITLFLIIICTIDSMGQGYTIKDRWNIKVGYSFYTTDILFGGISEIPYLEVYKRVISPYIRIEGNYAPKRCWEFGLYIGFLPYDVSKVLGFASKEEYDNYSGPYKTKDSKALAVGFGLNANFHILPLFVEKENCRWDFYINAKYGGIIPTRASYPYVVNGDYAQRYNHEYGIGIGGGIYFWNLVGFYAEVSFGQYFFNSEWYKEWFKSFGYKYRYKPKFMDCFNIRVGLTFKWYSKKSSLETNPLF